MPWPGPCVLAALLTERRGSQAGTNRIPEDAAASQSVEFGMHENFNYYQKCRRTQRNRGLYTADRQLNGNK